MKISHTQIIAKAKDARNSFFYSLIAVAIGFFSFGFTTDVSPVLGAYAIGTMVISFIAYVGFSIRSFIQALLAVYILKQLCNPSGGIVVAASIGTVAYMSIWIPPVVVISGYLLCVSFKVLTWH